MMLTRAEIEEVLDDFFRRAETCKKYGIALVDIANGTPVPPGWVLDPMMDYYMPPTLMEN